jgi:hypothetical protein
LLFIDLALTRHRVVFPQQALNRGHRTMTLLNGKKINVRQPMKALNLGSSLSIGFCAGVFTVVASVSLCFSLIYPYSNDSRFYIQQAENFMTGHGFSSAPFGLASLDLDRTPSAVFPPGYPALIAGVSLFGIPLPFAAVVVSWISWALLGGLVTFSLTPLTGGTIAVSVAILTLLSPGTFEFGYPARSDVPFLVMIIASAGMLFRAFADQKTSAIVVLSGILAGAAYLVRNAGLALFPAVLTTYFVALVLGITSRYDALRSAALWFCGVALVVVPLAVRNLMVFGKVQPYLGSHEPSEFTFLRSARAYAWSLLLDLTGSQVAAAIVWDRVLIVLIGIPLLCFLSYGLWKFYVKAQCAVRLGIWFAGFYVLFGSAMVITGRANFDWVETSLVRHVIQYNWLILALLFVALRGVFIGKEAGSAVPLVTALILLVGHGFYVTQFLHRERVIYQAFQKHADLSAAVQAVPNQQWVLTNQLKMSFAHDSELLRRIQNLPPNAFIISNYGSFLTLETGRDIREMNLGHIPASGCLQDLVKAGATVSATRPFYLAILPNNRMIREMGISRWQDFMIESCSGAFSPVARDAKFLLLKYQQNRASKDA